MRDDGMGGERVKNQYRGRESDDGADTANHRFNYSIFIIYEFISL